MGIEVSKSTVLSADHADYVCGEHITAKPHVDDNTVDFETSIPIDSATPTDITLNEDQAKFAIALEFEDKQDFLVTYQNLAWTKRAMFITGITTVNWPELLPAPTPSPTSVPPAYAEGDPHVRTITGLLLTCGRQVGRLSFRFRRLEIRQNSWCGVMCADMEGMRVLRPSCTKCMLTELGWVVTMCLCALGRPGGERGPPAGTR